MPLKYFACEKEALYSQIECIQTKSVNVLRSPRSLEMANGASPKVTPRANTARIAPTIMNKVECSCWWYVGICPQANLNE